MEEYQSIELEDQERERAEKEKTVDHDVSGEVPESSPKKSDHEDSPEKELPQDDQTEGEHIEDE